MKVMIGMDESEGSLYALKWVLSKVMDSDMESTLYVIHVHPPFQTYVYPAGPVVYTTTSVLESVKEAQERISAALFARVLRTCQDKKIRVETLALRGDPKDMICRAAEERHVDLLVVSSRGLGMLKRAFLGSVSDFCAHHAPCPVLIVKPPKEVTNQQAHKTTQQDTPSGAH